MHHSPAGRRTSASRRAARCSTSAPTTTSASPTTRRSSPPRTRRSTRWGYGLASVRFICGTQDLHKRARGARSRRSSAPRTRSSTRSCFDANGGLFETLLGEEDAIISDALNHASIIDGIRLCKAERLPLRQRRHGRARGAAARGRRTRALRLIATDGVFSMDGYIAHARRDLRPRREVRRAGDGRRLPRDRLRRHDGPRHARALRRHRAASTSSPHARQGARRRAAAASRRGRREIVELLRQRSRPVPVLQHARAADRRPRSLAVLELLERERRAARAARSANTRALPRAA